MQRVAPRPQRRKKRAITLGGGGPVAGFHIGALQALEEKAITFDVWSLSCIGAWVGVVYNQLPPDPGRSRASRTYDFFHEHAFRDAASYRGFPVNRAFAPNTQAFAEAWASHSLNPQTWTDVFSVANELAGAAVGLTKFLGTPSLWQSPGDVNGHLLNDVLAVHPMSRFLTSLAFMSPINGLSNIYYEGSSLLAGIDIDGLDLHDGPSLDEHSRAQLAELASKFRPEQAPAARRALPEIYHNAWRCGVGDQPGKLELFNNKWLDYWKNNRRDYLPITRPSLCACSALPYIEQTVEVPNADGRHFSEGALVDTVNFKRLLEDHPELDEIWVCRIVDYRQVRRPENLHDSLGNLCQQFAAEVGENDIKLFKNQLRKWAGRAPRVVEIPLQVDTGINFRWDRDNLERGRMEGHRAVSALIDRHVELKGDTTTAPPC